jgi:rod shape determining protein RodA
MARNINIQEGVDWGLILIYSTLVIFGWMNIFAAIQNPDGQAFAINFTNNAGRQIIFMCFALLIIMVILFIDFRVFDTFALLLYIFIILLLILTIFIAPDIKGSHSWIRFGSSFQFQPAELSKVITALALAKFLSNQNINIAKNFQQRVIALAIVILPALIIILQREVGGALVFAAFFFVLFREGLSGVVLLVGIVSALIVVLALVFPKWYLMVGAAGLALFIYYFIIPRYERTRRNQLLFALGVGFVSLISVSVNFAINLLEPHQRNRILVLLNPNIDPQGIGWNVNQSKIAIGSGGFFGKGYMQGTHTKFDFVPEQHTDYIFCTVGEEWGFLGTTILILLYVTLITRLINRAEKQRTKFARIYGYAVASILSFHLIINIGMTIGLVPTIGIPLPFMSYGGSSLWSFTILLFIFIKLDAHRSYKV